MLCCTPDLPSEEREREDEDDICLPFWFRLSREVFGTPVLKTCHIRYASIEKSIIFKLLWHFSGILLFEKKKNVFTMIFNS